MLPAGMRNNNPGNIKFNPDVPWNGLVGPSVNTDQGDPQAVFQSPELGMRAAARLAMNKYRKGMRTANQLIAGEGGWTPGNAQAAANIARTAGVGPDDDLGLDNPSRAQRFLRALVLQEHGPASAQYPDSMLTNGISAASTGGPMAFDWSKYAVEGAARPDSFTGMAPGFSNALAKMFQSAPPEVLANLRVGSGYRSTGRQQELWDAALKKYGSEAAARKWVAPPGQSQHNHGYAADLKYLSPAAREWARKNAANFGLAFPLSNEDWHIELAGARDAAPQSISGIGSSGTLLGGGNDALRGGAGNSPPGLADWALRDDSGKQSLGNRLANAGQALQSGMPRPPPLMGGGDASSTGNMLLKQLSSSDDVKNWLLKRRAPWLA